MMMDGWSFDSQHSPFLLLVLRLLCRDRLRDTASCGVIRLADESTDSDDNEAGLLTIVVTGEHKVCNSLNKIRKEIR